MPISRVVAPLTALVLIAGCSGGDPRDEVSIRIADPEVLADEPVAITVDGLVPGSEATLWTHRVDALDRAWLAHATFTADAAGTVDVATDAPTAGTYARPDPMGLFWSMRPADGTPPGPPGPVGPDAPTSVLAQVDGDTVAHAEVMRRTGAPNVTREELADPTGVLFTPPGPGPHPGVILLGGSEGGIPDYGLAELLASHGFATLALAYFGVNDLPDELSRIPLEYAGDAIETLTARPEVADGRVGVIGASRGGELALLLGATFPQVGAVVSYVGTGYGFPGLSSTGAGGPSWTVDGTDVPYLTPALDAGAAIRRYVVPQLIGAPIRDVAGTWSDVLATDPRARAAAEIPVERIDGPVLLLSGSDDRLWPSAQLSDVAANRLDGHPWPYEHVSYPGAGHFFFGPPGSPTFTDIASPFGQLAGGGTRDANAAAAADSWPRVLETLADGLSADGMSTDGSVRR